MRLAFAYAFLIALLGGCASMGMGGMSPEQINAAVKSKESSVACTTYTGTGGQFQAMFVNNDKTFNTGGGETTVKCGGAEVTFRDAGRAVVTPPPQTPKAP